MNKYISFGFFILFLATFVACGEGNLTQTTVDEPVDNTSATFELEQLTQPEIQATLAGVLPDPGVVELVTPDDLSPVELERINLLRNAISMGLDVGRDQFDERVGLFLQEMGLVDVYDVDLTPEPFSGLLEEAEDCPFLANYDNGFETTGFTCDYLVDQAVRESYSELSLILSTEEYPEEVADDVEAGFWFEQGAISGIEEQRVRIQFELEQLQLCNQAPTPIESSYDKGLLIGRQLFADEFNAYLETQGFPPEYPQMQPIEVCHADMAFLDPAYNDSVDRVDETPNDSPLCAGYTPPTPEDSLYFEEAEIDYLQGIRDGVEQEYALAAVSVFQEIPCVVADPIVVDLDADGIELTTIEDGVNFNFWNNGRSQAISWVQPDDGFLALDRNGNGMIDNGSELFGNVGDEIGDYADGFEALSHLDTNNNTMIDDGDELWNKLVIWQDVNTDGASTPNELINLDSTGVFAIPLGSLDVNLVSNGNHIPKVSYMLASEGSLMFGDADLRIAPYPRLIFVRYTED